MAKGPGRESVSLFASERRAHLVAAEPADVGHLLVVLVDVCCGRRRVAADHERRREGPGLRRVVADVDGPDARLFPDLPCDRLLD